MRASKTEGRHRRHVAAGGPAAGNTLIPGAGSVGSLAYGDVTCAEVIDTGDGARLCGALSRFVIARSDDDTSYGVNGGSDEACGEHLLNAIAAMIDGDETVRAVVAIRWDAEAEFIPGAPRTGNECAAALTEITGPGRPVVTAPASTHCDHDTETYEAEPRRS